ncbi:hypothetical protein G6038_06455 [Rhodococcus sp. 14C212]|uniref:hypothetical protein n=1 Tax=Rhodococcus sp. 14C212 TaxID=2711209 RepID=UPI0013EA39AA|nr:hypothetical protein [Rhodococcus sp. 14C212]NGP05132.1 hypothetical protein [Rhodococcus sp. 14C212]
MTTEPYASARRVFWIVDSPASDRNWVEIYFSVLQCKALGPDDVRDLDEVAGRLAAFQVRYNATARPFGWTFTRTDSNELLDRLRRHDPHAPHSLDEQPCLVVCPAPTSSA